MVWWRYSKLKKPDIQSSQICQILWYNEIFLKFECVYNIFNIMKRLCNFQKIIWTFNEAIQTLGLTLYRLIKKKSKFSVKMQKMSRYIILITKKLLSNSMKSQAGLMGVVKIFKSWWWRQKIEQVCLGFSKFHYRWNNMHGSKRCEKCYGIL